MELLKLKTVEEYRKYFIDNYCNQDIYCYDGMKVKFYEDQFEHGRRELLNLGHTFAHAIECVTRGAVPHGRAVAEGIMLAARTGAIIGITDPAFSYRIENDFNTCGIVGEGWACGRTIKPSGLLPVMLEDKKKHGDRIHLVIPKTLGDVVSVPVTEGELKKILSGI